MVVRFLVIACLCLLAACAPRTQQPASEATRVPTIVPADQKLASMLMLVNHARQLPRNCGTKHFNAAAPLSWNPLLSESALEHALDMARYKYFSHSGSDGSDVAIRVSRTGYSWTRVGENLAYGTVNAFSVQAVVDGWLASPGHCANIMNPDFKEIGMSHVATDFDYWVQVFGLAN